MSAEFDHLRTWIGRTQSERETVSPRLVAQLAALRDRDAKTAPGDALPPLWHWALLPAIAQQSHLGVDGHPTRGGFLPPVPLPRRKWAGSRIQFERPL